MPAASIVKKWELTGEKCTLVFFFRGISTIPTHTFLMYRGDVVPKDVNAFAKLTAGTPLGILLEHLHELNVHFRGEEEHI